MVQGLGFGVSVFRGYGIGGLRFGRLGYLGLHNKEELRALGPGRGFEVQGYATRRYV